MEKLKKQRIAAKHWIHNWLKKIDSRLKNPEVTKTELSTYLEECIKKYSTLEQIQDEIEILLPKEELKSDVEIEFEFHSYYKERKIAAELFLSGLSDRIGNKGQLSQSLSNHLNQQTNKFVDEHHESERFNCLPLIIDVNSKISHLETCIEDLRLRLDHNINTVKDFLKETVSREKSQGFSPTSLILDKEHVEQKWDMTPTLLSKKQSITVRETAYNMLCSETHFPSNCKNISRMEHENSEQKHREKRLYSEVVAGSNNTRAMGDRPEDAPRTGKGDWERSPGDGETSHNDGAVDNESVALTDFLEDRYLEASYIDENGVRHFGDVNLHDDTANQQTIAKVNKLFLADTERKQVAITAASDTGSGENNHVNCYIGHSPHGQSARFTPQFHNSTVTEYSSQPTQPDLNAVPVASVPGAVPGAVPVASVPGADVPGAVPVASVPVVVPVATVPGVVPVASVPGVVPGAAVSDGVPGAVAAVADEDPYWQAASQMTDDTDVPNWDQGIMDILDRHIDAKSIKDFLRVNKFKAAEVKKYADCKMSDLLLDHEAFTSEEYTLGKLKADLKKGNMPALKKEIEKYIEKYNSGN